ncbi:MAG: EVE domain-containing protein [Bryobacteraceae bacterium]
MRYFLAKSEPAVYSIDDLARDGTTTWDGVRNAQALRAIQAMAPGDLVFIYHSGGVSATVGWAKVVSAPRPDPADAKLTVVDLAYGGTLATPVPLAEVKQSGQFADWALVRQSRLSTMEAPPEFAQFVKQRNPKLKL